MVEQRQGQLGERDVGNAQHDGSSTAKVGGVNEEDARGSSQGQSQAEQPSRTSGREDDGSLRQELADPNGIGRGGGIIQNVELENGSFSRRNKKGVRWGVKLRDAVNHAEKMWPTPATRDYKGGYQGGRIRNGKVSWDTLDVAVQHTDNQAKTGGQLNPTWVEWLMGYPEGWTDLKD